MYKNLNDLTLTNLNMNYNNVNQLAQINSQLNTPISFTKYDIQLDYLTKQKTFSVENRIIKNCVIKCPNGQIWTGLDYKIHQKQNQYDCDKTIFYFTYISDEQWLQGNYFIYPGTCDKGVRLYNSNSRIGVQLLNIDGQDYSIKKLVSGNGISFRSNKKQLMIQLGQNSCNKTLNNLNENGIIDTYNGNVQFFYTMSDCSIIDLIDSFIDQNASSSSDSSYSSFSSNQNNQFLYVSIFVYKPNQSLVKYKNNIILNKYDIGWFSIGIKKLFGQLFISQPSRIITDYKM